jgi:hypothetical protein
MESILDTYGILPIVGVVPDNKDPKLNIMLPDPLFWDIVRQWQAKGWKIAMHGETHLMDPTDAKQILPFYKRSEFSGHSLEEQSTKLKRAQAIFDKEQVNIDTFIAPAHAFDKITLVALKTSTTVKIISDSIATKVYFSKGFYWVPQQLWWFRDMPFGLYTICLHPNKMNDNDFLEFETSLKNYSTNIVDFSAIIFVKRNRSLVDLVYNVFFWYRRKVAALYKNAISNLKN